MNNSKRMSLQELVSHFIPDGSSIVMGTAQETLNPFAAGHEIIRQHKQNLTLIGPISDILFDQMIGAGCVARVRAAWIGNVITGSGYNFRRAAESGTIEIEDHSNLTLAMALRAGALGVPYLPTFTAQGSHLYKTNHGLKQVTCPFTAQRLTAVAAIKPDLAIIHVQQCDEYGHALMWGNLGMTREACLAAEWVLVTCEEIIPPQRAQTDPNRVITPAFRVLAVAEVPWGAYPSPAPGYYNRDHQAFLDYKDASVTASDFEDWRSRWIDEPQNFAEALQHMGKERLERLRLKNQALSYPVDYGY